MSCDCSHLSTYAQRDEALAAMGFESYATYLASGLWKSIRKQVLAVGKSCAGCGRRATQVHHRDYLPDTLSGNRLNGLTPICKRCHKRIEFRKDGSKCSLQDANAVLARLIAEREGTVVVLRSNRNLERVIKRKRVQRTQKLMVTCTKCGLSRRRKLLKGGVCGPCRNDAIEKPRVELPPTRTKFLGKSVPQCLICQCWRATAAGDGVCKTCRQRQAEKNRDTAIDQASGVRPPLQVTTTRNRTVCELGVSG